MKYMLQTVARRPSRTAPDGSLIPLAEQDRSRWDQECIREGVALITEALARAPLGPYQLQAAIVAWALVDTSTGYHSPCGFRYALR